MKSFKEFLNESNNIVSATVDWAADDLPDKVTEKWLTANLKKWMKENNIKGVTFDIIDVEGNQGYPEIELSGKIDDLKTALTVYNGGDDDVEWMID